MAPTDDDLGPAVRVDVARSASARPHRVVELVASVSRQGAHDGECGGVRDRSPAEFPRPDQLIAPPAVWSRRLQDLSKATSPFTSLH